MRTEITTRKNTNGKNLPGRNPLQDDLMRELAARKASLEKLPLVAGASAAQTGNGLVSATLRSCVEQAMRHYFTQLAGHKPSGRVYDLVLSEIEPPLLAVVMEQANHNQCRAAEMLGLSRGTLRKKLLQYDLL